MKSIALKYIRIAIIISFIACSNYLYWWGLPDDIAIIHYTDKGQGQLACGFFDVINGDKVDHKAITIFAKRWSGVKTLWPQLFSVIMIIMGIVYILGEQILKISNKKTFEKAVHRAEELERSANRKLLCCNVFANKNNLKIKDLYPEGIKDIV